MKKMNIGIMGTRGIPNRYGGFEQFAEYLSHGLVRRGHKVSVYNPVQHAYKESYWNGVRIIHCNDPEDRLGTFGQFFYDLNCINDARKRDFDILLHLGYTSDSIWYWRWPKKTINMMNVDGMEWKRSKYNKPIQRFLKWAESLAAKHAQILVADSMGMQEHFWDRYKKKPAFIPYGAEIFTGNDDGVPISYGLMPYQYFLLVARMEPENNIEMIIQGWLASQHAYPLVIVSDAANKFGQYLQSHYKHLSIKFIGAVYDQEVLNNLRAFSHRYFHGHSVGGTNPSLLEAMACNCNIAAHRNTFNHSVLQKEADYFSSAAEVAALINSTPEHAAIEKRKQLNKEKIRNQYNQEKNIEDYERLMLRACEGETVVFHPATAKTALHQ